MAYNSPVDLDFVQRVINAALPEDQELEYKRELPKKLDHTQAKQSKTDPFEEFAKDVSAMANAVGGVLLYGVAEDEKTKRPGLFPITDEPFDQAAVRLHNILDSLIEPRLMGVAFSEIPVEGGYVLGMVTVLAPTMTSKGNTAKKCRSTLRNFQNGIDNAFIGCFIQTTVARFPSAITQNSWI